MIHFFTFALYGNSVVEKPMVVIIPSYNNQKWLERNLRSVFMQKYSNFRVIYINDFSRDLTGRNVKNFVRKARVDYQIINFDDAQSDDIESVTRFFTERVNNKKHFFTLVNNTHRCGALANLYRAINSCEDHEVIVTLDGDDWLYDENVLKNLNAAYNSGEVWFTHGTLIEHPYGYINWCEPIPQEVIEKGTYRSFKCPSHLRTFYAWLFKMIKLEDLLWNGKFFPMAWDMAIMYPLCEMAQERHAFMSEVNYVYNMENSINDNKVDSKLQNDLDWIIRNKKPYERVEKDE